MMEIQLTSSFIISDFVVELVSQMENDNVAITGQSKYSAFSCVILLLK